MSATISRPMPWGRDHINAAIAAREALKKRPAGFYAPAAETPPEPVPDAHPDDMAHLSFPSPVSVAGRLLTVLVDLARARDRLPSDSAIAKLAGLTTSQVGGGLDTLWLRGLIERAASSRGPKWRVIRLVWINLELRSMDAPDRVTFVGDPRGA